MLDVVLGSRKRISTALDGAVWDWVRDTADYERRDPGDQLALIARSAYLRAVRHRSNPALNDVSQHRRKLQSERAAGIQLVESN
jgi:hypothetical protein